MEGLRRASLRPDGPGTSSKATAGGNRSASVCACAPAGSEGGRERGEELRSPHQPRKMAAPESHRHRPARTAHARSGRRVPSAWLPVGGGTETCAKGRKAQAITTPGADAPFSPRQRGERSRDGTSPSRRRRGEGPDRISLLTPPPANPPRAATPRVTALTAPRDAE